MVSRAHELKIVNTVCPVTIRRQEDTLETARDVELMVVVGGSHSANTKELTRLCQMAGTPALQVESVRDLVDPAPFEHVRVVGVTGGTSTPVEDLRDVAQQIFLIAGNDEQRARAADLAQAALEVAATPAGRTTSLPRTQAAGRRGLTVTFRSSGLPVVALVGRPNVGKSTLFNRVVGDARAAIVEDRARTTRDRLYGRAEWNGRRFVVVDTGGLEIAPGDPIEEQVQVQARLAINEADVIVFLVDAITGPTPADLDAAELLRRTDEARSVAANKADNQKRELDATEFFAFGWEDTFAISANHGRGVADLLDAVVWAMPPESEQEIARKAHEVEAEAWAKEMARAKPTPYTVGDPGNADDDDEDIEAGDGDGDEDGSADEPGTMGDISARWDAAMAADDDEPPAIAFVGRPNVGKSSLLNSLLGDNRMIVSAVPGTTRDAIDTTIPWGRSEVVLIDTAGIKKRGRVANGPAAEKYSTMRALKAISRADVAVLVLDAADGLTAQDADVAG